MPQTPQVPALDGMTPLGLPSRQNTVCDGCLTAAYDEGADSLDMQQSICLDVGAEIPDHLCDAREELGLPACACACNR